MKSKQVRAYLLLLIYLLALTRLGYGIERNESFLLITYYLLLFASFVALVRQWQVFNKKQWLGVVIISKLVLLGMHPNLSEDYARFFWDGLKVIEGESPYLTLPKDDVVEIGSWEAELQEEMNSSIYFSVYPPISQVFFSLSVLCSNHSTPGAILALRILMILTEIALYVLLCRLLIHRGKSPYYALWYSLNPLVNIEVVGNLHFEGLVVFFLALAAYWWIRKKEYLAPVAYVLAIGTKLIPLIFAPLLVMKLGVKKSVSFVLVSILTAGIIFYPLFNEAFILHFADSLDLYFRNFEFNASIFYLAREVGIAITGYDQVRYIGPALMILVILWMLFMLVFRRKMNVVNQALLALGAYYLLTTTVHPWYIINLLALGIFTCWTFPVLWSGLVFLSYSHYYAGGFEENYYLIAAEYIILLVWIVYEYRGAKINPFELPETTNTCNT